MGGSRSRSLPRGGVEAGKWYTIGSLTVLAVEAADAGDPFTVEAPGIYRYTGVPKASAAPAMTLGAKVYLIAADNDFTTAASGNTFAGYAGAGCDGRGDHLHAAQGAGGSKAGGGPMRADLIDVVDDAVFGSLADTVTVDGVSAEAILRSRGCRRAGD